MKKLATWKKVLIGILTVIVVIIAGGTVYFKSLTSKMERVEIDKNYVTDTGQEPNEASKDVIQVALFGTDYTGEEIGSTDTMMILSIDKKNNKIKLCSLMRDMYVDLPDGGQKNLNYVVHDGGIPATLRTINYNFNLDIDKFVQVNLYNLPKVIDALGGVEINITDQEMGLINTYLNSIDSRNGTTTEKLTSSGNVLLNGSQAAAYCRIRYTEGKDYKRTERQRYVLEALFKKVKNTNLLDVPGIVSQLLPLVSTNLTDSDILSISQTVLSMNVNEIEQARFPLDEDHTTTWTDMYHMIIDKEATTKAIHNFIFSTEE